MSELETVQIFSQKLLTFYDPMTIAEKLLYFDIFWIIFNEIEDNFVFACNFFGKRSLFTMI